MATDVWSVLHEANHNLDRFNKRSETLLESAIQTELRLLKLGIERAQQRIAVLKREFEIFSEEGEMETLLRLQNKYQTLQEAH